jgi:hypothetical protein
MAHQRAVAALAMNRGKSVDFTGYWQRHTQSGGIAIPGSSHRRQAFILLGRDVLGDTSYSLGRAQVHLNLVDMTAPCAAKRPVLEAGARRCSAQNFRARLAHRAADLRNGGR